MAAQDSHSPDNTPIDVKLLRQFGFIMAGGLILFFGLLIPWIWERSFPLWPWIAAVVFATAGVVYPKLLSPIFRVWLKIGHVLSWINTRIILGIVFFLIFFPVALILRIARKDPMARKFRPEESSYRIPSTSPPREQLERPF